MEKVQNLREVSASISQGQPWISYAEGNDGDPNVYRDYIDAGGRLHYCDGEICKVIPWDNPEQHKGQIKLLNVLTEYGPFVIPLEQFNADFVSVVGGI